MCGLWKLESKKKNIDQISSLLVDNQLTLKSQTEVNDNIYGLFYLLF